jgi:hypothetical protein
MSEPSLIAITGLVKEPSVLVMMKLIVSPWTYELAVVIVVTAAGSILNCAVADAP